MMEFIKPGMFTTVQDLGRKNLAHLGIPSGGAMDRKAAIQANLALGNPEGAALLEITLFGPRIKFSQTTRIAVIGGKPKVLVDGNATEDAVIELRSGQVVDIPILEKGCRTYLAIEGGIDVKEMFGCRATLTQASIGGFKGRALKKGDVLSALNIDDAERTEVIISRSTIPTHPHLKCRRGPEFDWFSKEEQLKFFDKMYTVSQNSNRIGMRLEDVPVFTKQEKTMYSSALFPGVVQVPHDGNPVIILRDGPTAGGYPRIVVIDEYELDVLAQLRPGDQLGFDFLD